MDRAIRDGRREGGDGGTLVERVLSSKRRLWTKGAENREKMISKMWGSQLFTGGGDTGIRREAHRLSEFKGGGRKNTMRGLGRETRENKVPEGPGPTKNNQKTAGAEGVEKGFRRERRGPQSGRGWTRGQKRLGGRVQKKANGEGGGLT